MRHRHLLFGWWYGMPESVIDRESADRRVLRHGDATGDLHFPHSRCEAPQIWQLLVVPSPKDDIHELQTANKHEMK